MNQSKTLKAILTTCFTLLIGINAFFVRNLVDGIHETTKVVNETHERVAMLEVKVASLKEFIQQIIIHKGVNYEAEQQYKGHDKDDSRCDGFDFRHKVWIQPIPDTEVYFDWEQDLSSGEGGPGCPTGV